MKKKLFCILCLLSYSFLESTRIMDLKDHDLLEFRAGEFFFTSENNRAVYSAGIITLELEDNHFLSSKYSLWGNLNVAWSKGQTPTFNTPTHMDIAIFSFGGKRFFKVTPREVKFYLGIGLTAAIAHNTSDSEYLADTMTRFSPGAVGKIGFLFQHPSNFVFDIFFDYYIQPTLKSMNGAFYQKITDVGGFHTGAGIGYLF